MCTLLISPIFSIEQEELSGCWNIDDANNDEYYVVMLEDVGEVLETMQIEKEPPMDGKIEPIETFAESENATNFKDFEALHVIVLDIDDQ